MMTFDETPGDDRKYALVNKQACVKAVHKAKLPETFKRDLDRFIYRNIIPECGRISPHCLKAYMIKKAKQKGFSERFVERVKGLFKGKVGYEGYFLDNGRLRKV